MNLDRIDQKMRGILRVYCEKFIELHRENLKGLFIYGSAASGEFIPGKSNINILSVFERIAQSDLKKTFELVRWGRKRRIVAPLMLTIDYIKRSTDVFPLEFLEMKENHILLYGEDVIKDLKIDPKNIRLEIEQQIKGGLIRLRQAYLEVGHRGREIQALLLDSLKSLIPSFRGLLRIKNREVSFERKKVVKDLSREFGLNEKAFTDVLSIIKGRHLEDAEKDFLEYVEELEKLGIEVDRLFE